MTSNVEYIGGLRTKGTHLSSGSSVETDAPRDNQGQGALFSPTDTAATSLATCMITVMGIKAAAEKIEFNQIKAEVTKIMAANPRRISEIRVDLQISEDWTDSEMALMEQTAKNCPVALSLHPDLIQNISFTYL